MKQLFSRIALAVVLACALVGSTAPPGQAAPLTGVSIGNVKNGSANTPSVAAFAAFCKAPQAIWWNTDQRGWQAYHDSLGGQLNPNGNALGTLGIPAVITMPMMVDGTTLAQAAAGAYVAEYTKAANSIKARLGADYDGIFRPNNEGNGDWMPWRWKKGEEVLQKQAFQRYVTAVRAVLPKARFEWNLQLKWDAGNGYGQQDLELAYPGDEYVTFVGGDIYYRTKLGDQADALAYFAQVRDHRVGLTSLAALAARHGKQIIVSEWGLDNDSAAYVNAMAAWFNANPVYIQIYWMRDDDGSALTNMLNGSKPAAAAAYKAAFCQTGGPTTPPPVIVDPPAPPSSWGLGNTLAMSAWNRTASNLTIAAGSKAYIEATFPTATATVHFGAVTPNHSFAGNTSWPGGTPASVGLRSADGSIWMGSLLVAPANPALAFGAGKTVGMTIDGTTKRLAFRVDNGAWSTPVDISSWGTSTISPAVGMENGSGSVTLNNVYKFPVPAGYPGATTPPPVDPPPANDNTPKSVDITITGGGFTWKGTATRP